MSNMFKRANADRATLKAIEETKASIVEYQNLLAETQSALNSAMAEKKIELIGQLVIDQEEIKTYLADLNNTLADLNNELPKSVDLNSLGELDSNWILSGLGYEKKEVYSRISELRTAIQTCYAKIKNMKREINCDFDELFKVQGDHARNHQFPQRNRLATFKYLESKDVVTHGIEHDTAIANMQSDFDKLAPIVKDLFEKLAEL